MPRSGPEYERAYRAANRARMNENARRWAREHPEQVKEIKLTYRKKHPEKIKVYDRRQALRAFGLTVETYNQMLVEQSGGCAICGCPPGATALAVDHDHSTGKVRGLLCRACNHALGLLVDSPHLLNNALVYLGRKR